MMEETFWRVAVVVLLITSTLGWLGYDLQWFRRKVGKRKGKKPLDNPHSTYEE